MKLSHTILLSLSFAFLIMGIHQVMTVGFQKGYWALMIALIAFFTFRLKRGNKSAKPQNEEYRPKNKGKTKDKRNYTFF